MNMDSSLIKIMLSFVIKEKQQAEKKIKTMFERINSDNLVKCPVDC